MGLRLRRISCSVSAGGMTRENKPEFLPKTVYIKSIWVLSRKGRLLVEAICLNIKPILITRRFFFFVRNKISRNVFLVKSWWLGTNPAIVFFLQTGKMNAFMNDLDVFGLLVACLCHDLDHRGTNNAFQLKYEFVFFVQLAESVGDPCLARRRNILTCRSVFGTLLLLSLLLCCISFKYIWHCFVNIFSVYDSDVTMNSS